jgi:hypothetical protein
MKPISKQVAETAILERFLIAYRKRFGVGLTAVIHRDKPDFEVTNPITHERIGIEITGLYQNEMEAKIQYGAVDDWERFEGSTEELLQSLNSRLDDKARKSKSYQYDGRILLVIWFGSLVFNQRFDIDFVSRQIVIPENAFSEIWLVLRDKEDYSPELYSLQA